MLRRPNKENLRKNGKIPGIWRRKNLYLENFPVFAVLIYPPGWYWCRLCIINFVQSIFNVILHSFQNFWLTKTFDLVKGHLVLKLSFKKHGLNTCSFNNKLLSLFSINRKQMHAFIMIIGCMYSIRQMSGIHGLKLYYKFWDLQYRWRRALFISLKISLLFNF